MIKNARVLFPLFILCFTTIALTQTPVEPTVIGDVFIVDPSQALKALPQEQWEDVPKRTSMAHGGFFIEMSGEHSSYRIKAGANVEFVFKIGNPENVALYAFSLKKKKRLTEYSELLSNWGKRPIPGIPAEVVSYGQSSFKLVPKSPLAVGEYVISTGNKMFTFGIDQ